MEDKANFDLDAYFKSLEEDESLKDYEKQSSDVDVDFILPEKEEDLGAIEALILEGEAAVGFDRNQKK